MESFLTNIGACLNFFEFCPLCGDRNKINIILSSDQTITKLDNEYIKASSFNNNDIFVIKYSNNLIIKNKLSKNIKPTLNIYCGKNNFIYSSNIIINDKKAELNSKQLIFNISDKKYNKKYYILSDYKTKKTQIDISLNNSVIDSFDSQLINFNDFNKKTIIKKIRTLSILR